MINIVVSLVYLFLFATAAIAGGGPPTPEVDASTLALVGTGVSLGAIAVRRAWLARKK